MTSTMLPPEAMHSPSMSVHSARDPYGSAGTIDDAARAADRVLELGRRLRRAKMVRKHGARWPFRAAILAPFRAGREAVAALREYGAATASHSGISYARQFGWTWWLNFRFDYDRVNIYRFRLFDRSRAWPQPMHIMWGDARLLYAAILARTAPQAASIVADKRTFSAWAAENDVPTPPILMEFANGEIRQDHTGGDEPRVDLFSKWARGFGGDYTESYSYADDRYTDVNGRSLTFDELKAWLANHSTKGAPVLLQRRLRNHRDLVDVAAKALSTIRVMTIRRPDAAPTFLIGVLRMARGNNTADNFAQGGIASPVDPETGTLGVARWVDKKQCTHLYETHPDTGAQIVGRRVPFWREAIDVSLRAHEKLGDIPCIGWDAAITDDGPVLLEANWAPCTKFLQVVTQTPILVTEFAATHAAWLNSPRCNFDDEWLLQHENWRAP